MPFVIGAILFIVGVVLIVNVLLYTFLFLCKFLGHPAIVTTLITMIGSGIGLISFYRQERGQSARSGTAYVALGPLRLRTYEWAAGLLVLSLALIAAYGALVAGPRASSFAASEQARLSGLITSAVVAREIRNDRPIDIGTALRGPKTSAAVYVEYAGATAGRDSIVASLAWGTGSTSCQAWTIPNQAGSYYCRWDDVHSGNYAFHIFVNGKHLRTIPFSVVNPSASTSDGATKRGVVARAPRADKAERSNTDPATRRSVVPKASNTADAERSNTCSYVGSLTAHQWLEMKRTSTNLFSWSVARQNSCLLAYSDTDGERKQCAGQTVSINAKEKIWFRAERGTIADVCFKGLSFVRRCSECG